MQITKADATWNLIATGLRVASGIIVLPLVLHFLPQDDLALWTIFLSFGAMTALLDFGFSNTFSRNITYIFSGARELKATGYVELGDAQEPDYSLLKSMIRTMRLFYGGLSIVFLLLLLTGGSFYIHHLLKTYQGDKEAVLWAWGLYAVVISGQLYTLLFEVLLQGRGQIKRTKQIVTLAQSLQIIVAATAIWMGCGIIAMVYGQLACLITNRILFHKAFYDKELKERLRACRPQLATRNVLKIVTPGATKIGIALIGSFLSARIGIFIASLYLPLSDIASYGITQQVIDILSNLALVWLNTFFSRITQLRVIGDVSGVKRLYLKSRIFFAFTYLCGSAFLLLWGNQILELIHSKTLFLPTAVFAIGLFALLLENRYVMAAIILISKNEVPYYKAALWAGLVNVLLLFLFVKYFQLGIISIFLARGLSVLYNTWRWPHLVKTELQTKWHDYKKIFLTFVGK